MHANVSVSVSVSCCAAFLLSTILSFCPSCQMFSLLVFPDRVLRSRAVLQPFLIILHLQLWRCPHQCPQQCPGCTGHTTQSDFNNQQCNQDDGPYTASHVTIKLLSESVIIAGIIKVFSLKSESILYLHASAAERFSGRGCATLLI